MNEGLCVLTDAATTTRTLLPYLLVILFIETLLVTAHALLPEVRLVDLDLEYTVPAWFSALQLATIGVVCLVAFEAERRTMAKRPTLYWAWLPLAIGFMYLGADEMLALHERVLTDEVRSFLPAQSVLQSVLPWQLVFALGEAVLHSQQALPSGSGARGSKRDARGR
jgi:hypothetical protein